MVSSRNINQAGFGRSGMEDLAGETAFTSKSNRSRRTPIGSARRPNYFIWLHQEKNEDVLADGIEPTATITRP